MLDDFQWDEEKNQRNQRQKGIGFEDIISVFRDTKALIEEQERDGETRYRLTGQDEKGGVFTVVFTWRGESRRIISAWPASRQERRAYVGR